MNLNKQWKANLKQNSDFHLRKVSLKDENTEKKTIGNATVHLFVLWYLFWGNKELSYKVLLKNSDPLKIKNKFKIP